MSLEVVVTFPFRQGDLGTPKEFFKTEGGNLLPGSVSHTEFGIVFTFDTPQEYYCLIQQRMVMAEYVVLQYWEGCDPDGNYTNVAGSDHPKV